MPGYCGICNQHYSESFSEHDFECSGGETPEMDSYDRFNHEKTQQGWDDSMDEEIWNKHFKHS
jgi:hypothetical protein